MLNIRRLLALFLILATGFAQSGVYASQQDQSQLDPSIPRTLVTIPAGTQVRVELQNPLNSKLNEVGDEVTGTLDHSIIIDGLVALEQGTELRGRITQITHAKRPQRQ